MQTDAKCKAIMLDYGGTIDSDGLNWIRRFRNLYAKKNVNVPLDLFYDFIRSLESELLKQKNIRNYNLSTLVEQHVNLQIEHIGRLNTNYKFDENFGNYLHKSFLEDIDIIIERNRPFINKLSEIVPLAVTSNFFGNLEIVLTEYELIDYFKFALDSEIVGIRKPDPSFFLLAAEKLNLSPNEILYLGDSYAMDVKSALKLGFQVIWMRHPEIDFNDTNLTTVQSFQEFFSIVMDRLT